MRLDAERSTLRSIIDWGDISPRTAATPLWAASERVESRRIWLGLKALLGGLTGRAHAQSLTRALEREYGKVLTPSELEQFLGPRAARVADRRRAWAPRLTIYAPRLRARSSMSFATTSQSLSGARSVDWAGPYSVGRGTKAVRIPCDRAAARS